MEYTVDIPISYLTEELQVVKLDDRDEALVGRGVRTIVSDNYFLVSNKNQNPYKLFIRAGNFSLLYCCSFVRELVQIHCIERNAYAVAHALDANIYQVFTDGVRRVPFDKVVEVLKQTGHNLPSLI